MCPEFPDKPLRQKTKIEVSRVETHVGPLPSPEALAKYDQIVPGVAERIVIMAESQMSHRQELEKKVIKSDIINSRLGVIFALIISAGVLFVAYSAIIKGYTWGGIVIILGDIGGLAVAFIYGTRSRRLERKDRFEKEK